MRRAGGKNKKMKKTDDPATSDVEENTEENGNDSEMKEEVEESNEEEVAAEDASEEGQHSEKEEKHSENEENEGSKKKSAPKKKVKTPKKKTPAKKKATKAAKTKQTSAVDDEEEEEYEVEAVVDSRYMRGKRQFKIRWRGHGPEEDSWCGESDLHCPDLIREYLDSVVSEGEASGGKRGKKRKSAAGGSKDDDEDDEDEEYEVEKVLEVKFKKNGSREFLIRWKGFPPSSDTWEPEDNLNCTDLINKLLAKVEKAKEASDHELRAKPKQTSRLTLKNPQIRTSRRKKGGRTTYHDLLE